MSENTIQVCDRCGKAHDDPNDVSVDGTVHRCERCGELTDGCEEVTVRIVWGLGGDHVELWCEDCVESHAVRCDECGGLFDEGRVTDREMSDGEDVTLCLRCESGHTECEDCGRLMRDGEAEWVGDGVYCEDCVGDHRGSECLEGYGHTSGLWFWMDDGTVKASWDLEGDERKALYLGIELETDYNDDADDLANDVACRYDHRHLVCKEDGSLSEEGVEIVSQPMTPRCHLGCGMWEEIADTVREHGGTSHDAGTCGLHIHMSRAFFGDGAVYRLDRLFHRLRTQMLDFSRREGHQLGWCGIDDHDELADVQDVKERKAKWADKKKRAGRYEAVNNTNRDTVEIRLWRGTLNMVTFRATVQFTTGLAIVANTMSDRLADTLTWPGLKTLVRYALEDAGVGHDELDQYLSIRGL